MPTAAWAVAGRSWPTYTLAPGRVTAPLAGSVSVAVASPLGAPPNTRMPPLDEGTKGRGAEGAGAGGPALPRLDVQGGCVGLDGLGGEGDGVVARDVDAAATVRDERALRIGDAPRGSPVGAHVQDGDVAAHGGIGEADAG